MSGSSHQPQLSGRWRKAVGLSATEAARPVVVPVLPQIAVHQLTTYRHSLPDELAALSAAGLPGIGLSRAKLSRYADDVVSSLLQEFGVKAVSLSWAGGFMGSLGFTYEEALEDARDAVRQAGLWQAENLVIIVGSRNGHTLGHCRKTIKDALLLLADEAGDVGTRLALLPMHPRFPSQTAFLNGVDDVMKLIDELHHPCAGLAFDAMELGRSPAVMSRIPDLASKTFLVQLRDGSVNRKKISSCDCLPGQGDLPLAECVHRFLVSGYRGHFDVQAWSDDVWQLPLTEVMTACRDFAESVSVVATRFS